MKSFCRILLTLAAGLCLLISPVSADTLQEKTFAYTGARWPTANTQLATFWEAPELTAGESRTGGVLTLENTTAEAVTLSLSSIGFPYDDTDQMAYLDALQLEIRQGDTLLYNGAYSSVTSGAPVIQAELEPGGTASYTISLSCPFRYTGSLSQHPVMAWTFDSRMTVSSDTEENNETPGGGLSMKSVAVIVCLAGAALFLVLFIVLLVKLVRQKREQA